MHGTRSDQRLDRLSAPPNGIEEVQEDPAVPIATLALPESWAGVASLVHDDRIFAGARRNGLACVTRIMLGLTMAFAALAVINAVTGHRLASLAAAAGVAVFTAIAARVGRRVDVASVDTTELARIDETLATDRVLVYAIEADAAFVLADRSSDSFGHVLRVDHEHYVYVRCETCAGIDPEQLPSTRLLVEWAVPLGLLRAEAQGNPVAEPLRIEPITRERAETELISDLVAYQTTWAELERRLSGA